MKLITDQMVESARDMTNSLSRAERAAIFNDRMLEERAANARYSDGRSVKEAIDEMIGRGGVPSHKRSDTLGREYTRMVRRRLEESND